MSFRLAGPRFFDENASRSLSLLMKGKTLPANREAVNDDYVDLCWQIDYNLSRLGLVLIGWEIRGRTKKRKQWLAPVYLVFSRRVVEWAGAESGYHRNATSPKHIQMFTLLPERFIERRRRHSGQLMSS